MIPLNFNNIYLHAIEAEWLINKHLSLDVLRLDKLHSIVSGNKWFKLKYYLKEAFVQEKSTIATYGGAWSNHIVATAYASKEAGLKSIGIIRGEKPINFSNTLNMARQYGMELHFVSRQEYRGKEDMIRDYSNRDLYWINEGGYGIEGAKGASEILNMVDTSAYTHIIAAVGTGTMLAGLILSANNDQKVVGISSMKGNTSLHEAVMSLISEQKPGAFFEIKHEYHFGGYGKHPEGLIKFINEVYLQHNLPLDITYTGKTFYAIKDMAVKGFFEEGSRLLMIHSGGLQGNCSLSPKVLAF